MERAIRRRKRQHNHRRTVFVFAVLFFVFQMTVMPQSEAYSIEKVDVTYIDLGINGLLVEDKMEEEIASSNEEEQEEFTEEQNAEKTKDRDESASDDPDTPEMDDRENLRDEKDNSVEVDESDVYELMEKTDEYTAVLCFDAGIPFPEGSTFSVSILTEEKETYPEYCRLLSETMDAEEELIGFFIFTWEIPDTACSEEEMFLTLVLKDLEDTERTCRAYYYDDEPFAPAENTEAEKNTILFTFARQGLYALTVVEHKQDGLLPENASTNGLPFSDCTNREEKKQAGDKSMAAEEKEIIITAEEVIEEENTEISSNRMMIKNPTTAAEKNEETDLQFRGASASAKTIQRNIYRIHLSAEGLANSEVDHVIVDIKDQNGEIRDTMTLSDENGWTADWEAADSDGSSFSAEETGIYESNGKDLTEEWNCSVQSSEEQTSVKMHDGWSEADSMNNLGTYVITFESGGEQYLLAVDNPDAFQTASSVQYMKLTCEQNDPENASCKATWIVEKVFTEGIRIRNAAVVNFADVYLTTRQISKEITFAMIRDRFNSLSRFENHHLKTKDNVYLRATSDTVYSVASADEASYLTVYTPVIYNDNVREKTVSFSHSEKPPHVQNTTARIKLMVGGNIGDRKREFSFTAAVDDKDPISFTLAHTEEFLLEDIPIGAKLTVRMETSDHVSRSSFGDSVEGESSLSVPSFPAEGGTILYQAKRETELNTGIHYGNRSVYLFILTTAFVYEFCIHIFRLKSITISLGLKTWRKKKT